MKLEAKTIRLQGALHGVAELADQVIVHIDDLLITIAGKALQQIPEGVPTSLGTRGLGRVVATKVAVDNAFTVEPGSQRIIVARKGQLELVDPIGQQPTEQFPIEGMPGGTFGASLEPGGKRILFVVVRDVNFDFSEYAVAIADLMLGRLITEKTIHSTNELQLSWDGQSRSWLIRDAVKSITWRWNGEGAAVQMAAAEPAVEGNKHPSQQLWASTAQRGATQAVEIRGADGKVIAEKILRPGTHLMNLVWSTSTAERLWGLGAHALVELMLSN